LDEYEILDNFLINNLNLEKLEVKTSKFNPFNVLKIGHFEIRHSNVLAWLLDPKETHNLNDKILKKLLSNVVLLNEDVIPDGLRLKDIQLSSFEDAIIYRERDNIDILVVSERNKLILLIENKIYSRESKNQLNKYIDNIDPEYETNNMIILPVYLTLDGDTPKGSERFCIFSHEQVYDIIKFTIELYSDNMSRQVLDFIKYYLKLLKELTLMDEKVVEYCKEIYKNHSKAIDMINTVINSNNTTLFQAADEFFSNNSDIFELDRKYSKSVWFIPVSLKNIPKMNTNWNKGYPFAIWFRVKNEYLNIIYEIGPFIDGEKRLKLIKLFNSIGFKVTKKAFRVESKYTRLFSDKKRIKDWSDQEEVYGKMEDLYKNSKLQCEKIINVLLNNYN
jgi:hypothetical protein